MLEDGAESQRDVADALFDQLTHLPTLPLLLRQIDGVLRERTHVALLTLHVSPLTKLEDLFGWEIFDEVVRAVARQLAETKEEWLRKDDFLAELSMSGNSFVLVLSPPRYSEVIAYEQMDRLRERVRRRVDEQIRQGFPASLASQFECFIGCASVARDPGASLHRLVFRALDAAYTDAFAERDRKLHEARAALQQIIDQRRLTTVFQPIIDLERGGILGYEAYSRGPCGPFERPEYLFALAAQAQLTWQLERLARETALARVAALPPDRLLFLNVDPVAVFDPHLLRDRDLERLAGRVVLEFTERAGISDFLHFRRVVSRLRAAGVQFALDDVGSAYSGLRLIAEAQPNFIKLDAAITAGVHTESIRHELVGMLQTFSRRVGASLIVEGVESAEQLRALRSIGVTYVQGFLFGQPRPDLHEPDVSGVLAELG